MVYNDIGPDFPWQAVVFPWDGGLNEGYPSVAPYILDLGNGYELYSEEVNQGLVFFVAYLSAVDNIGTLAHLFGNPFQGYGTGDGVWVRVVLGYNGYAPGGLLDY